MTLKRPFPSYVPWPNVGCTLLEARERTAERALWELRGTQADRSPPTLKPKEVDQEIDTRFYEKLREGRLVAVGRPWSAAAAPVVIPARSLHSGSTDWVASAVEEGRPGGISFHYVRVFPAILGPTRIDILTGLTLLEAVRQYVLDDPEVIALVAPALAIKPGLEPVLKRGRWSPYGMASWPLGENNLPLDGGERECLFGWAMGLSEGSDSPYPYLALRALEDRVDGLLKLFCDGSLALEGLAARSGDPLRVPRSVFMHPDFSLDLEHGDLFVRNDRPQDQFDSVLKRWSGLMIVRPGAAGALSVGAGDPSVEIALAAPTLYAMPTPRAAQYKRRSRPKSDSLRAALQAAGIDLATDPRGPSEIARAIAWPTSTAHQWEALVKNVSRLKRQRT